MAVFDGHTVTVKGAKLLSRSLAGEGKFIFTKGAFGAGKYDGDVTTLEELIDKRLDLPLSDITYYEGAAVLNLQISNKTVEESFYTEELGLYAKLENDSEEVLFSYAKAVKPDAIPDNSLSVTFEGEYELYIKLTTNEKVGVQVNDNNVFITFKTGNREYVRTGCNIIGLLSVQTELVENGQYQAENGKWYLNVGGKRVWNRDGNPDEQLKEISFLQHEKDLNKKQYKEDGLLKTISKNIVGAINELFNNKLEKGGYSGNAKNLNDELSKKASKSILGRMIVGDNLTVDSNGRVSANPPVDISGKLDKGGLPAKISDAKGLYDLIESNSGLNFDSNLLYLNDAGTKYVNKIYFDRNKKGLFKCISQTTSTTNSTSYFVDISNEANADQLRNLSKSKNIFSHSNEINTSVKNSWTKLLDISSTVIDEGNFIVINSTTMFSTTKKTLFAPLIKLINSEVYLGEGFHSGGEYSTHIAFRIRGNQLQYYKTGAWANYKILSIDIFR